MLENVFVIALGLIIGSTGAALGGMAFSTMVEEVRHRIMGSQHWPYLMVGAILLVPCLAMTLLGLAAVVAGIAGFF